MTAWPGFGKMNFYFGRFYFSAQDLFLLLAIGLIVLAVVLNIPLPYISRSNLLFLAIIVLLAKGFLPSQYFSAVFFVVLLILLFFVFVPQIRIFSLLPVVLLVLLVLLLLRFLAGF